MRQRAASHRDLYAPTRIFSCNTALNSHGRRQPCRGSLSCLTEKSRPLECFAVLNRRFFLRGVSGDCRNTICISKSTDAPLGKKIHSKPCKSLCESAQCRSFPFSFYFSEIFLKKGLILLPKGAIMFGRMKFAKEEVPQNAQHQVL